MDGLCICSVHVSVEIATLTREKDVTKLRILPAPELEAIIKKYEAEEAKAEAEKKKQEKPM